MREIFQTHVLENCLILMDEASVEYNNRLMKMSSDEIEFFKLHRHYLCDIVVYSQSHDDVDVTLRRLYERIYVMYRLPFGFTMSRRVFKRIGIVEGEIRDVYDFGGILAFLFFTKYIYRPFHYKFFDSFFRPEGKEYFNVESLKIPKGSNKKKNKIHLIIMKLYNQLSKLPLEKLNLPYINKLKFPLHEPEKELSTTTESEGQSQEEHETKWEL